jgi:hypothetical protein
MARTRECGVPHAGAGKILPRRTVGVKKRGDRSHTSRGTGGASPRVTRRPGPLPLDYEQYYQRP